MSGRLVDDGIIRKSARHRVASLVTLSIPILTFTLGVLAQQLLQDFLAKHDETSVSLLILAIAVGVIGILIGFQTWRHSRDLVAIDSGIATHLEQTEGMLRRLALSSGLLVDFVEDGEVGASYTRAAAAIRSANETITFIDLWEPFEGYQADETETGSEETAASPETIIAREDFYSAILERLGGLDSGRSVVHRRIVQVPANMLGRRIPFHVDPPFREYLRTVVSFQLRFPDACKVRVSPILIRTHFIVIDGRTIIMPLLSNDMQERQQRRFGALFFDDMSGSLNRYLRHMYSVIDSRSRELELRHID